MILLDSPKASAVELDAEVIIVGAGFGGLGMATQLKKAGLTSFIVLERANDVGGTWRDNRYPGCACDVPSMLYSFSFQKNAGWTRVYPQQAELYAYLRETAKKHRIYDRIRFHSELREARFDEATSTWVVTLMDGSLVRGRSIVCAMGPLNKPNIAEIPGRDAFAGSAFHSSAWDHSVELAGKNVTVIGTGASAIQFVPHVASQAGRLTIFQRTAPWVIPRNDRPIGVANRLARRFLPPYAWLVRKVIYWTLELRAIGFVVNPKLLQRQERSLKRFIAHSICDPVLRAKVTPAYRAGCKRILISDDYYPAIARDNVELVTDRIAEIRAQSVVTEHGREIPTDVIIYGTGFKATAGLVPIRIYGRNSIELGDAWRNGMEAYLGTTVAGFPNAFLVIGPNTGLGHNSMIFMMEAQYRYIIGALRYLKRMKARTIDINAEVMRDYNDRLQKRMKGTVWETGCSSWYQDIRGKNVSLWPGFTFAFRKLTARFDHKPYSKT